MGASGRHMQHDTPSSFFTPPPSLPVTAASHAVPILLDNPTQYLILGLGWVGSTEQTTTTTVVGGGEKMVFFPQSAVGETESEQGDKLRTSSRGAEWEKKRQQTASRSLSAEVLCKPWPYLSSSPVPGLTLSVSEVPTLYLQATDTASATAAATAAAATAAVR
ncbi:hypothetical protein CFIO01_13243 [Colletotrichum fioriniae PJ7]|uniref:Uncharacterized protein n=1 Tax=Colletotrichum fioriniae PJ7 TaxID=1445577 RepID=A0A010S9P4_9PEZI|nr:hypothetical protein CFIO01_13243 [Colletotrichum fioriniae PJ7]